MRLSSDPRQSTATATSLGLAFLSLILVSLVHPSHEFQNQWFVLDNNSRRSSFATQQKTSAGWTVASNRPVQFGSNNVQLKETIKSSAASSSPEVESVEQTIENLCRSHKVDEALQLLLERIPKEPSINESAFNAVMYALSARDDDDDDCAVVDTMEELLETMKQLAAEGRMECAPTAATYNSVVRAHAKSVVFGRQQAQDNMEAAASRCDELLSELWTRYNATQETQFLPFKSMYVSTLTALARSSGGVQAAQRAEELLEEMERVREEHPSLSPSTICVNIVLNAWSHSGGRFAASRCETILERMEQFYFCGRSELQPNSTSFNTVIDALARSNEHGSEERAEALLEHMDDLSTRFTELQDTCQPDQISFNTVLNCWARSKDSSAARRAESILRHMERRYADGNSDIQPDSSTYNTVLTAWSRSRSKDAATRAQALLRRMEQAYRKGNDSARPTAMSYNIAINAWAKSSDPSALTSAMQVFQNMKNLSAQEGREDCVPDVVTYTSLIDALAKSTGGEASDQAIELLEELESAYERTGEESLRPNIRTYTSVIQAVGRSRLRPERADEIVARVERMYEEGNYSDVRPDVVFYDALINAHGWSYVRGKSQKCFAIYEKMMDLYKSGKNVQAKPDIITCNSLLNACAYEQLRNDEERAAIMKMVVQVYEDFQAAAPAYGWPNHGTFTNVLLNIKRHVTDPVKQADLAEATFWQCCRSGHVSVLVLTNLHRVLPWDRFSELLGSALMSQKGEQLHFNFRKLPEEWTRFAPSPKERQASPSRKQPSRRRDNRRSKERR